MQHALCFKLRIRPSCLAGLKSTVSGIGHTNKKAMVFSGLYSKETIEGVPMSHSSSNIPGPQSQRWIDRLALRECPAITARRARRAAVLGKADTDPIVWKSAEGSIVEDVDGNRFVDLTAGFGDPLYACDSEGFFVNSTLRW